MNGLIFDEKTLLDGNIFKFEQRLQSHMNRYAENGMLLTTYFSQEGDATTVDRGTKTIDELFGRRSPLRFVMVLDFPLSGFHSANPEDDEETTIHDIRVEGDVVVLPNTIVPKQYDFFMVNHLKMNAIFEVTNVTYDSMKQDGFYKIHYRLHSTSVETIENLKKQCIKTMHCDLNSVGDQMNPILKEEDFIKKGQVIKMVNHMITLYKAMYYNQKHNCFLFFDREKGQQVFDMCGNEFIAKYNLMNPDGSPNVIILHDKLYDIQLPQYYANSIYSWLETGAPLKHLQKFYYILSYAEGYPYSSFNMWGDGDIQVMHPVAIDQAKVNFREFSFFDETQFQALMDPDHEACASEFERLLWKYIHKEDLSLQDISLTSADPLISGAKYCKETFLMTPIIIYIIRQILRMD